MFLAWDRFILGGGAPTPAFLRKHLLDEEIHKLVGVSRQRLVENADRLLPQYLLAGGPKRFTGGGKKVVLATAPEDVEEADWLEQEGSDDTVQRLIVRSAAQKRDRMLAAKLKHHYGNRCMFCGEVLAVGQDRFYSEAAHIKPIGTPHGGPDKTTNMLVLCPNHHIQFDRGILSLHLSGKQLKVVSSVRHDPLNGIVVSPKHKIDLDFVRWHQRWFNPKVRT